MNRILSFLLLTLCTPALALTCKYATLEGNVIYANVPIQNARKVECFGQDELTPNTKKQRARNASVPNLTPADFPRVDSATQQQRDSNRRKILDSELASERSALQQAQTSGKATDIMLHEKNIKMLEKEISSIK